MDTRPETDTPLGASVSAASAVAAAMETDAGAAAVGAMEADAGAATDLSGAKILGQLNDVQVVISDGGGLSLSRDLETTEEFEWMFGLMINDWVQRITSDASWLEVYNKSELDLGAMSTDERLSVYRVFYKFLATRHDAMLSARCFNHMQPLCLKRTGGENMQRLLTSGDVRVRPVGIGAHFAWVLLSTSARPDRWFLAYADLLGEIVTVTTLHTECGVDNVTEEMMREKRSQQFHVVENLVLNRVCVLATDVTSTSVSVLCSEADEYNQPTGRLSVFCYLKGVGCTRVVLANGTYTESARLSISGWSYVLAVAIGSAGGGDPRELLLYRCDRPDEPPFVMSRRGVGTDKDEASDEVVGITSVKFDPVDPIRIWIGYADGTLSNWRVPVPTDVEPGHWAAACTVGANTTMCTRRVAMTPERALAEIEHIPTLAKIDLCQPPATIHPHMGSQGRVCVISPQNLWLFTRDAKTTGADTPENSQVRAATQGVAMTTLPALHCPGEVPCVSATSAGNFALLHYLAYNQVILNSLTTHQPIWTNNLSQQLKHMTPGDAGGGMADSDSTELTKDVFQAGSVYQSTWATLGRAAVLLPNGFLFMMDGMKSAQATAPANVDDI